MMMKRSQREIKALERWKKRKHKKKFTEQTEKYGLIEFIYASEQTNNKKE